VRFLTSACAGWPMPRCRNRIRTKSGPNPYRAPAVGIGSSRRDSCSRNPQGGGGTPGATPRAERGVRIPFLYAVRTKRLHRRFGAARGGWCRCFRTVRWTAVTS
jgi:hypothetical protein